MEPFEKKYTFIVKITSLDDTNPLPDIQYIIEYFKVILQINITEDNILVYNKEIYVGFADKPNKRVDNILLNKQYQNYKNKRLVLSYYKNLPVISINKMYQDILKLIISINRQLFIDPKVIQYCFSGRIIDKIFYTPVMKCDNNDLPFNLQIKTFILLTFRNNFKCDDFSITIDDVKAGTGTITHPIYGVCVKISSLENENDIIQTCNANIKTENITSKIIFSLDKNDFLVNKVQISDKDILDVNNIFANIFCGTYIYSHLLIPEIYLRSNDEVKEILPETDILWDYTQHSKTLNMNLVNIHKYPHKTKQYNYPIVNDPANLNVANIVYQPRDYVAREVREDIPSHLFEQKNTLEIEMYINNKIHDFHELNIIDDFRLKQNKVNDIYFQCYRITKFVDPFNHVVTPLDFANNINRIVHIPYFLSCFYTLKEAELSWLLDMEAVLLVIMCNINDKNFISLTPCVDYDECFFGDEHEILFKSNTKLEILDVCKKLVNAKENIYYMNTIICKIVSSEQLVGGNDIYNIYPSEYVMNSSLSKKYKLVLH